MVNANSKLYFLLSPVNFEKSNACEINVYSSLNIMNNAFYLGEEMVNKGTEGQPIGPRVGEVYNLYTLEYLKSVIWEHLTSPSTLRIKVNLVLIFWQFMNDSKEDLRVVLYTWLYQSIFSIYDCPWPSRTQKSEVVICGASIIKSATWVIFHQ